MTVTEPLSFAVIEAVASREGEDVDDLPPLSDAVDPDALDDLFEPQLDGTPRQGGQVTFTYSGRQVTVHRGGRVSIGE